MSDERARRKVWTKDETLMFLSCYKGRRDEFDHPRKKKTAYGNVLKDMLCQGFEDKSVTPTSLEGKMRTLLVAYKNAKQNASRTGACPCPGIYMDEMDELFGNKDIVSHSHAINVGLKKSSVPLSQQSIFNERDMLDEKSCEPSMSAVFSGGTSPIVSDSNEPCDSDEKYVYIYAPTNRKTAKERFYEAKMEMKKHYLETKLKLRRERDQRITEAIEQTDNLHEINEQRRKIRKIDASEFNIQKNSPVKPSSTEGEYDDDHSAKAWAAKLRQMESTQRLMAERIINEVMYYGQRGYLSEETITNLRSFPSSYSSAETIQPDRVSYTPTAAVIPNNDYEGEDFIVVKSEPVSELHNEQIMNASHDQIGMNGIDVAAFNVEETPPLRPIRIRIRNESLIED